MPAPKNFSILDGQTNDKMNLTTHNRNPTFTWEAPLNQSELNNSLGELEYVLKLWDGIDNSGVKLFEVKTDEIKATVDPVTSLSYGNNYYAEVFARSKSSQKDQILMSLNLLMEMVM